jgi:hypothetical protein
MGRRPGNYDSESSGSAATMPNSALTIPIQPNRENRVGTSPTIEAKADKART